LKSTKWDDETIAHANWTIEDADYLKNDSMIQIPDKSSEWEDFEQKSAIEVLTELRKILEPSDGESIIDRAKEIMDVVPLIFCSCGYKPTVLLSTNGKCPGCGVTYESNS